ncbi:hypothetical protein PG984_004910 [Apiospora sp. TS-2023a]
MPRNIGSVVLLILVGLVAVLFQVSRKPPLTSLNQVQGRNNTALFIINVLGGLHNAQLATIQSLREKHPHIEVHVMSWATIEPKVKRLFDRGDEKGSDDAAAAAVRFHALTGQGYVEAVFESAESSISDITDLIAPPTVAGWFQIGHSIQAWMSPWSGPAYLDLMREMGAAMDRIDPAVVMLDTFIWPGIDAARERRRLHAFITPNMVADNFAFQQPWLGGYWKFPPVGSNLPFPVPWSVVPRNILHALVMRYMFSWTPKLRAIKAYLHEHAAGSIDLYNIKGPDNTPWITQTLPGASIPLDYIPPNVTCVGPLFLSSPPAAEQDPELAAWLHQDNTSTVLVNLGGSVTYDEQRAEAFTKALSSLLDSRPGLQVLWKFQKARTADYAEEETFRKIGQRHLESGRLRIVNWLDVDPIALLETGRVAAFVHHGGSGSYHEGIAAGVPHVVLPLWADHYNIASLVEHLQVGVYGCKASSPEWNAECLAEDIARVIDESDASRTLRRRAEELRRIAQASPGRDGAARIVAQLAGSGHA